MSLLHDSAGDTLIDENARLRHELRACRARMLRAADEERRRLERDLHDGAQQRLVALALDLRLLARRLEPGSECERMLVDARELLQASLDELRDLAHGLHPAVLASHGLAVALESLVARAPVPVALTVDLEEGADQAAEIAAYYVVAESLTNIAKYACASRATVTVVSSRGTLFAEIGDDGVGGADLLAGSGLRGLRDRVEALGGRLSLSSRVGDGTTISAAIPADVDE